MLCVLTTKLSSVCFIDFSPNFSGKSVFLSQLALQVILAQIGSFVPAKKASMVVINNINTRVSSIESASHGQSSFFMDSSQIARMLTPCEGRSLHLIDEYGKGTSEAEGTALLAATLRDFLRFEPEAAPIVIYATHFYEILREPFLPMSNPRLSVSSMEVIVRPRRESTKAGNGTARGQVPVKQAGIFPSVGSRMSRLLSQTNGQPQSSAKRDEPLPKSETEAFGSAIRTYKLLPGTICHESRSLQVALECGVPKFILQRAAHVRHTVSGQGYPEDMIPTEGNNPRLSISSDLVRELLATDYTGIQASVVP